MELIGVEKTVGYVIHEFHNNKFALCEIIGEYNNKNDAQKELIKLLTDTSPKTRKKKKRR